MLSHQKKRARFTDKNKNPRERKIHHISLEWEVFGRFLFPETPIAPENGWLDAFFFGAMLVSRRVVAFSEDS